MQKNKSVRIHAMCDSEKYLVRILDFYFSKLPVELKAFYLQPLAGVPEASGKPWFVNVLLVSIYFV